MKSNDGTTIILGLIAFVAALFITVMFYHFFIPIWIAFGLQEITFKNHKYKRAIGTVIALIGIVLMFILFPVSSTYYASSHNEHQGWYQR
ncbi:MAG: hypothetical protein PHO08_11915 [Methylococcales bacterium]|nr:hypothetical protein [Methylococcales bacterium]